MKYGERIPLPDPDRIASSARNISRQEHARCARPVPNPQLGLCDYHTLSTRVVRETRPQHVLGSAERDWIRYACKSILPTNHRTAYPDFLGHDNLLSPPGCKFYPLTQVQKRREEGRFKRQDPQTVGGCSFGKEQ